ncbi:MAG: hypothetical protein HOC20_02810 [Chloroflexi bacterium]|jgi:hypothetical protein|nr:hypothetical protein [Chloroflexota bacterium]
MKWSYFIVVLAAIAVICWVTYEGGSLIYFLDTASVLLIIVLPLLMLMATYSPAEIVGCFAVAFRKEGTDLDMIEKGIHFFSLLRSYLIVTALFSFMIGFILIMANSVGTDKLSQFGGKIAISVIPIHYALALMLLVTIPFKAGLEKKKIELSRI